MLMGKIMLVWIVIIKIIQYQTLLREEIEENEQEKIIGEMRGEIDNDII